MTAAGIFTQDDDRNDAPVPTRSDTRTGMLLVTERGPFGAVECRGKDEFIATFGGYTANNLESVGPALQYFDEGGEVLWCSRVVHCTDPSDPATRTSARASLTLQTASLVAGSGSVLAANAEPFNLEPGDTLIVAVDGGGPATATFSAAAASRECANAGPYALTDGMTLTVSIDGGSAQTIAFLTAEFASIGAATPAEVAAVINAKLVGGSAVTSSGGTKVTARSDRRGTGSGINISGGTANAVLGFTTGNQAGSGNVANIDAVTAAEVKSVVEGAVSGSTVTSESGRPRISSNTSGGSSSIQVQASSTADDELGFDNALHTGNGAGALNTLVVEGRDEGAYANDIRILIAAPTNLETGRFNLRIERAGVVVKTYADLSMAPSDARYVEAVINDAVTGDRLIRVVDQNANVTDVLAVPATGAFGPLTGGNDGLVGLDDNDFIGGKSANGSVGLRTFDKVSLHIGPLAPQRATPAFELARLSYIATYQRATSFPVAEFPAGLSADQAIAYWKDTAGLYNLTGQLSGYWPRHKVRNPNRSLYGNVDLVTIPNGGLVAGICARLDARGPAGPFEHPAGIESYLLPRTVLGLESDEVLEVGVRDRLFAANINPIQREVGPIFIDGARTASIQGVWPSVGQARGIIFIKKQLTENLAFMRHRRINADLLARGVERAEEFLEALMNAGAFASNKRAEAFFVDGGPGLNTRATKRQRSTFIRIGVATDEPNEFTFLIFSPFDGSAEELGQQA